MKKLDNFYHALDNLDTVKDKQPPFTPIEQAGITNLFHICFEQSWKLMRSLLLQQGVSDTQLYSPRSVLKSAYQTALINEETIWLEMLQTRNLLVHTYDDATSAATITAIQTKYLPAFHSLRQTIKTS